MKSRPLLVAAALLALVATACDAVSPYAAKVNGARVSVDALNRELEAIRGNKDYLKTIEDQLQQAGRSTEGVSEETFDALFVSQVLTNRIFLELIHQEVRKRKLAVTPDVRKRARTALEENFGKDVVERFPDAYLDELVTRWAEGELLQGELAGEVTDTDIQNFYDGNPQFFDQVCMRHIMRGRFESLEVPPDQDASARAAAEDVKRRVDAGQDFAAIARAESEDPQSAPNGGDLGCPTVDALPPTIAASLTEAKVGEVRGPIRTDSGYHVVQILDRRKIPLDQVAERIRSHLEGESQGSLTRFYEEAAQKADIVVNPRYGSFDEASLGVVPPQAPTLPTDGPPVSNRQ